jgi:hypothetical protein
VGERKSRRRKTETTEQGATHEDQGTRLGNDRKPDLNPVAGRNLPCPIFYGHDGIQDVSGRGSVVYLDGEDYARVVLARSRLKKEQQYQRYPVSNGGGSTGVVNRTSIKPKVSGPVFVIVPVNSTMEPAAAD